MEGPTETQQYGFIENFEAKNVWDTAYLVPKPWVTIFIERWIGISNFQFNIVLYNLGQHSQKAQSQTRQILCHRKKILLPDSQKFENRT